MKPLYLHTKYLSTLYQRNITLISAFSIFNRRSVLANFQISILYLLFFLPFLSCNREYTNPLDSDTLFSAPGDLKIEATDNQQLTIYWKDHTDTEEGFRLIISGQITQEITIPADTGSYILKGVLPGEYFFEVYAFNKTRKSASARERFVLSDEVPVFSDIQIENLESTSLDIRFSVGNKDRYPVLEQGICFSDEHEPSLKDNRTTAEVGNNSNPVNISLSGLIPATAYSIRPYLKCSNGVFYGKTVLVSTYRQAAERIVVYAKPSSINGYEGHINVFGGNIVIDWGDGSCEEYGNISQDIRHQYSSDETRRIVFYGQYIMSLRFFRLNNALGNPNTLQVESIDLSNAPSLGTLGLQACLLKEIDLSNNGYLTNLYLDDNQLETLDVSHNPSLLYLYCPDNKLTVLDISNNKRLYGIDFMSNNISEIDVSQCLNLDEFLASSNNLTSVDFSKNTNLKGVYVQDTQLKALDLSNNLLLERLFCSSEQLMELDISRHTKLYYFSLSGTSVSKLKFPASLPALTYVTISDNQLDACTLNRFYEALPVKSGITLYNSYNPGTLTSNTSIARDKGWKPDKDGDASEKCE